MSSNRIQKSSSRLLIFLMQLIRNFQLADFILILILHFQRNAVFEPRNNKSRRIEGLGYRVVFTVLCLSETERCV